MKELGKRSAGKPHAAFDVAGAGNGKREFTAPVFDPTLEEPTSVMELAYSTICGGKIHECTRTANYGLIKTPCIF